MDANEDRHLVSTLAGPVGAAIAGVSEQERLSVRVPVGTWAVTVTRTGSPTPEPVLLAFTADGMVAGVSKSGFNGLGRWKITGLTTFAFTLRQFKAVDGSSLHVNQTVTMTSGSAFAGSGQTTAFNPAGGVLGTFAATTAGTIITV